MSNLGRESYSVGAEANSCVPCGSKRPRVERFTLHYSLFTKDIGESKLGRLVDALALGGDEGRDKLR